MVGVRQLFGVATESALVGLSMTAIAYLIWPGDLGLSGGAMHPFWLGVMVLAARWGPAGLIGGFVLGLIPLAIGAELLVDGSRLLQERVGGMTDLLPLLVALIVSWVALSHSTRQTEARIALALAKAQQDREQDWSQTLADSLSYLRDRCQRLDIPVARWRHVADRIERGSVEDAARAALELILQRAGARSGAVLLLDESSLIPVCSHEDYPYDAQAAQEHEGVRRCCEENASQLRPAEAVVPIVDRSDGLCVGALHLVLAGSSAGIGRAELRDAELIADWLSPVIARETRGPRLRPAARGG